MLAMRQVMSIFYFSLVKKNFSKDTHWCKLYPAFCIYFILLYPVDTRRRFNINTTLYVYRAGSLCEL